MPKKHREKEEVTVRHRARSQKRQAESVTQRSRAGVVDLRSIVAKREGQSAETYAQSVAVHAQVQKQSLWALTKEEMQNAAAWLRNRFSFDTSQHASKKTITKRPTQKTQKTTSSATQRKTVGTRSAAPDTAETPLIMQPLTTFIRGEHTKATGVSLSRSMRHGATILAGWGEALMRPLLLHVPAAQRSRFRAAGSFFIVVCLVVLPFSAIAVVQSVNTKEATLTAEAERAFAELEQAGESAKGVDFQSASEQFLSAEASFAAMQEQVDGMTGIMISLAQYLPGKGSQVAAARDLITAGQHIAQAGTELAKAGQTLSSVSVGGVLMSENGVIDTLQTVHSAIEPASAQLHEARVLVDGIDSADIPESKRALFTQVQQQLPVADELLAQTRDLSAASAGLLGASGERRYMIVFQNNRELRPTGGFMGSFAVVTVRNGLMTTLETPGGGTYDVAGQLTDVIESPQPLHLVNPHWNIQDANWFPHFPDSAQKVQWFYERSNGSTLDGVIAFTPDVIEQLLAITGPIDMQEEFGVTVNADNAYEILQQRDEEDVDAEGAEPKKLIAALTPKLLNATIARAQEPQSALQIIALLKQSLDQKNILVAVDDPEVQKVFAAYNWAGEIHQGDGDYLYVNHANIAGGKTDAVMDEMIRHRTEIQADGSIINHVTITRAHKGRAENPLENILNVSYVRTYVPQGSQLMSATGFDMPLPSQFLLPDTSATRDADVQRISGDTFQNTETRVAVNNEYNKTVFGGWMRTPVGESRTVTLSYKLPWKIDVGGFWNPVDTYALYVQKQPGMSPPFFIHETVLPQTLKATASYPQTSAAEGAATQQVVLTDDFVTGVVVEPKKE